jgi:hypothetical protein
MKQAAAGLVPAKPYPSVACLRDGLPMKRRFYAVYGMGGTLWLADGIMEAVRVRCADHPRARAGMAALQVLRNETLGPTQG